MHIRRVAIVGALISWFAVAAPSAAAPVGFEGLADGEVVSAQLPGLTFTNATVLTAGVSLNEFEFPPRSGTNVVFDDGGGMLIAFAAPQSEVSAFFTYATPLKLSAFDAAGQLLGTVSSLFASNLALSGGSGSAPNELLAVHDLGPISRILIVGDLFGGSFVLDDLSFSAAAVPAPATPYLLCAALLGLAGARASRRPGGRLRP